VLGIYISEERNMLVADKKFIRSLVEKYGRHTIYTDGGTWYHEVCNVLKLKHYLHSSIEKSLMERVNQYFKDRIECFDDYSIHVGNKKKMNAIYFMYITGYNSLYPYITTQHTRMISLFSYNKR
jgi:transposase-like protein